MNNGDIALHFLKNVRRSHHDIPSPITVRNRSPKYESCSNRGSGTGMPFNHECTFHHDSV